MYGKDSFFLCIPSEYIRKALCWIIFIPFDANRIRTGFEETHRF